MIWLLLAACADDTTPAWLFSHATVAVDADGDLSGFLTTEVYSEGWSQKQADKHHLCAVAQAVSGVPIEAPLCPGCVDGFLVEALLAESDCAEALLPEPQRFELLIGEALPADDASADAPGPSLGWYQRFDDGEARAQGHIWPESGAEDALPMLVAEERYVLWPTSAWSLGEE